jgi:hypothetical protein
VGQQKLGLGPLSGIFARCQQGGMVGRQLELGVLALRVRRDPNDAVSLLSCKPHEHGDQDADDHHLVH